MYDTLCPETLNSDSSKKVFFKHLFKQVWIKDMICTGHDIGAGPGHVSSMGSLNGWWKCMMWDHLIKACVEWKAKVCLSGSTEPQGANSG